MQQGYRLPLGLLSFYGDIAPIHPRITLANALRRWEGRFNNDSVVQESRPFAGTLSISIIWPCSTLPLAARQRRSVPYGGLGWRCEYEVVEPRLNPSTQPNQSDGAGIHPWGHGPLSGFSLAACQSIEKPFVERDLH